MQNTLKKFVTTLERDLMDANYSRFIFGVMFLLSIVLFGYFGIKPLISTLQRKSATIDEMELLITRFDNNIEYFQTAETDLRQSANALTYLDKYMPEVTYIQDYMLEYVNNTNQTSYYVRNFSQDRSSTSEGGIDIRISMVGTEYPHTLIQSIEKLKRVTQVQRVSVNVNSEGEYETTLLLTIYNYLP